MKVRAFSGKPPVGQPSGGLAFVVAKRHARRMGISTEEYLTHQAANEKRCPKCHEWKQRSEAFAAGRQECKACRKTG